MRFIDEKEFAEWNLKRGKQTTIPERKPSKYHNLLEVCDGIKFQSKKEAKYYRELCARVHAKEVRYFLRQVPFHLKGGVKYLVDFMEVLSSGEIRYVDVKGRRTPMYVTKKKLVEAEYPIKIWEA